MMEREECKAALAAAIRDECGGLPQALDDNATAADVPGWDSLAHVRLMMNVEARLGREIDINRSYRAKTVGALIDMICAADGEG